MIKIGPIMNGRALEVVQWIKRFAKCILKRKQTLNSIV